MSDKTALKGDEKIWGKKWKNPTIGGAMEKPKSGNKPEFMLVFLPGMGGCGKTNLENAMSVTNGLDADVVTYSLDPSEKAEGQDNEDCRVWYQVPDDVYSMTALRFHPDVLKKGVYPNADKLPDQYKQLKHMQVGSQRAINEVGEFLKERMGFHDLDPEHVIVVGASQGAMVATELAGKFTTKDAKTGEDKPVGLVMPCAGTLVNIEEVEKKGVKAKAELTMFNGEKDVNVPFEGSAMSYQVYRKAYGADSAKVEQRTFPELDHTFFERQPQVIASMVERANSYISKVRSKDRNKQMSVSQVMASAKKER